MFHCPITAKYVILYCCSLLLPRQVLTALAPARFLRAGSLRTRTLPSAAAAPMAPSTPTSWRSSSLTTRQQMSVSANTCLTVTRVIPGRAKPPQMHLFFVFPEVERETQGRRLLCVPCFRSQREPRDSSWCRSAGLRVIDPLADCLLRGCRSHHQFIARVSRERGKQGVGELFSSCLHPPFALENLAEFHPCPCHSFLP